MARIVVIGSVAQDDVVVLRQPLREGRHLDAAGCERRLGGGGANTAIPLRHAGHEVALLAPVGSDESGRWLLDQLRAAGLDPSTLGLVEGPSTRSLVLVDAAGERTIVNLHRCLDPGPPERLREIRAEAVYVRCREVSLAPLLAEAASSALVVAHVPPLQAGARPAHVLVGSASDLPPEFLADPWGAGQAIAGPILRAVVVTRGADGAEAFTGSGKIAVRASTAEVVDSTAAGDVFAAGLVHALVAGRALRSSLESAVAWGTAAVGCHGLPGPDAIRRHL